MNLNKDVIEFLYSHDLISEPYSICTKQFVIELNKIVNWLDSELDENGNYNSFFHTIIHEQLLNLFVRRVFYINLNLEKDQKSQEYFLKQKMEDLKNLYESKKFYL